MTDEETPAPTYSITWEENLRRTVLPESVPLIDGLIYQGLTLLYSAPGLGKSMLAQQVEHHLAAGQPLGAWSPPPPQRVLVIDLEGDEWLTQQRSYTITPWGMMAADYEPQGGRIAVHYGWAGETLGQRLDHLRAYLRAAREEGAPYVYARIDTLKLFVGRCPSGQNAYEWESHALRALNRLAMDESLAIVALHHENKAGDISGSTGLIGSATCAIAMTRNPERQREGILKSVKVRGDIPFEYAIAQNSDGVWTFTDEITVTQAALVGIKRDIVDRLIKGGPLTLGQLCDLLPGTKRAGIRQGCRVLRAQGKVLFRYGRWEMAVEQRPIPTVGRARPPADLLAEESTPVFSQVQKVTGPMSYEEWARQIESGELPIHTAPPPRPAATADSVGEPETGDQEPEAEAETDVPADPKIPAFQWMRDTLAVSRMKPLPRVPADRRDEVPWTLITERMDGEHRWNLAQLPMTGRVQVLDRNGSYPAAMSSVVVAPNALVHSGPRASWPEGVRAGIFQVAMPAWPDQRIGHPLGRLAQTPPGELVWITTPHLRLLDQLAAEGAIQPAAVVDSWTGKGNSSLFERFEQKVRSERAAAVEAGDDVRYAGIKRATSTAIRSLWPKQARSPWWRPDWHQSIEAEASVRHWIRAWQAVKAGATLLKIGSVDEVVFLMPDGSPDTWVPTPYVLGTSFGQVKVKETVNVAGVPVRVPLTLDQWQARGTRRRDRGTAGA